MKRNDAILIIIVLFIAAAIFLGYRRFYADSGSIVRITVDGKTSGTYSLDEDRTVEINGGTNVLVIEDGEAFMESADCPDKICVNHKSVSKNGESIICLPHKIVVEIVGGDEDADIDAAAG